MPAEAAAMRSDTFARPTTRRWMPTVGPVERALALRSLPLFQTLPAREVSLLAQLLREQVVPRGQLLQGAGGLVNAGHLLIEGQVRLHRDDAPDVVLEAPAALGLVELLAGEPARVSVVADTDLVALVIDRGPFLDVLDDQFSLVLHLRAALGRDIARHAAAGHYDVPRGGAGGERVQPGSAPRDLVEALLLLEQVPELRALGVAVLAALLGEEPTVPFAAGAALFDAGAEATQFLVVAAGTVVCTPADGAPFPVGAGGVLGRDAVLAGIPHPYAAVAETDGVAIPIGAQVFWDLAEDHFHVALAALAMCARRLLSLDVPPPQALPAADAAAPAMEES